MNEQNWSGTMQAPTQPTDDAPQETTRNDNTGTGIIRRKNDMVDQIVTQSEGTLTEEQAATAYKAFTNSIIKFLEDGDKVQISGFGQFFNRVRAPRMSTNPETKEPIHVPSKRVPIFKAGKNLKDASAFK